MGSNTSIEWTDHTFNPWWGCAKVSPGCDNCYAESWAKRTGTAPWGVDTPRRSFGDKHWNEPLKWNRAARDAGRRYRVFCASMADVFDKNAPDGARERLWRLIGNTPNLDWQLLTKRIGNAPSMLPVDWGDGWANVWLGITVVNQEEADRDIPKLLALPARVRFLSCEPLLGPIDLAQSTGQAIFWRNVNDPARRIDWVIAGGESGAKARPSHPDWFRELAAECRIGHVPFLFKQWGEWVPMMGHTEGVPVHGTKATLPDGTIMGRAGKKAAGRTLDGREHNDFPS